MVVAVSTASTAPSGEANIRIDIDDKPPEAVLPVEDAAPSVPFDERGSVIGKGVFVFDHALS